MALLSSADVGFITLGGKNILGHVTAFNDTEEVPVEEVTALGDTTDRWTVAGNKIFTLTQEGYFDAVSGGILQAYEATSQDLMMFAYGRNIGDEFVGATTVRTKIDRVPSRGALTKLKVEHKAAVNGAERGWVAAPYEARTLTGPTALATLDPGVAYANQITGQMIGYLSVPALNLDGGTGLVVVIRDSADGVTFADAITFTTVTVAGTTQRLALVAAAAPNDIERYIQVRYSFTGSPGANKSATFAVGISRPLA